VNVLTTYKQRINNVRLRRLYVGFTVSVRKNKIQHPMTGQRTMLT